MFESYQTLNFEKNIPVENFYSFKRRISRFDSRNISQEHTMNFRSLPPYVQMKFSSEPQEIKVDSRSASSLTRDDGLNVEDEVYYVPNNVNRMIGFRLG